MLTSFPQLHLNLWPDDLSPHWPDLRVLIEMGVKDSAAFELHFDKDWLLDVFMTFYE